MNNEAQNIDNAVMTAASLTVSQFNLLIEALAGTGKTTRLVTLAKQLAAKGLKVRMLVYGNKAKAEIEERMNGTPGVTIQTFHGACYTAIRKTGMHKFWILDVGPNQGKKRKEVLAQLKAPVYLEGFIYKLSELARESAYRINPATTLDGLIDQHNLEGMIMRSAPGDILDREGLDSLIEEGKALTERAIDISIRLAETKAMIDFPDQLFLALLWNLPFEEFDVDLIDEIQDTNPSRQEVMVRLKRGRKRKNHIFIGVGDRRQAIFGFTGADTRAMDRVAEIHNCDKMPLTVNYRCSRAVIEYAKQWCPDLKAHDNAPDGSVTDLIEGLDDRGNIKRWFHGQTLDRKDAMICRNMSPLVSQAYALYGAGVPCHVEGKELGQGLVTLIRKLMGKAVMEGRKEATLMDLEDKLTDHLYAQTIKLEGDEARLQPVIDKVETIRIFIAHNSNDTIAELVLRIESLFQDKGQTFTLLTGHRSKGREFDRVYWLDKGRYQPSKYAVKDWQIEQEQNLMYVMATRAKMDLLLVSTYQ